MRTDISQITAPDCGRFNVREKRCGNCLFGQNPLVDQVRKQEIIDDCLKSDRQFICHEYTNVRCAGFWQLHRKDVVVTRLADAWDAVEWIEKK